MIVSDLDALLGELRAMYAATGPAGVLSDLDAIRKQLKAHSEVDLAAFTRELQSTLEQVDPKVRARAYLKSIEAAETEDAFDVVFAQLSADRGIKADDLNEIGTAFSKFKSEEKFAKAYKTRKAKLDKIAQTFHDKQAFESRGRVIDELMPWQ
ncbi:MAG: hypothetical protein AAFV26_06900 [Pseudomonadota bacterium]